MPQYVFTRQGVNFCSLFCDFLSFLVDAQSTLGILVVGIELIDLLVVGLGRLKVVFHTPVVEAETAVGFFEIALLVAVERGLACKH